MKNRDFHFQTHLLSSRSAPPILLTLNLDEEGKLTFALLLIMISFEILHWSIDKRFVELNHLRKPRHDDASSLGT